MSVGITYEGDPTIKRQVRVNPDFKPVQVSPQEELEEEKLLDE